MGRPKLSEEKKRVAVSISVGRTIAELAERTENQSHFYQTSVECCRALTMTVNELRSKRIDLETAMEQLEDVADIWEAEFDESVELTTDEPAKPKARKAKPT